jgi:CelD/BcsL family acetyltransferase involved in cellulose biosynthesis
MTAANLRWARQRAATALADPACAQAWDGLNAQRGDLPFLGARAVRAALDVFGDGTEQLFTGRRGHAIVAMFILVPQGSLRWRTFQPSQLPLGSWVAAADLDLPTLADSLLRGGLGLCLALSVTQVDPRFAPRPADDGVQRGDDYIDTGWIDIEGTFDAYWAARGKNLRQNMRKQRNKLAAEGTVCRMRVLRDAADMAPALERYGALESAGWKAGGGTAIHAGNAQGRFYRRLLEEAAQAGEAVVYEYLFDERTVAMNLCLLRGGQLIVLKTAYDETIKSLSPAFMLREEELQSFFGGTEVRRVEYYGRLMDWHTKLTDSKRTLYHLTRYRWSWVKALAERRRAAPPAATPATPAAELAPAADATTTP